MVVELMCNVQNLLEMWLFELSFKWFLDEIFGGGKSCALWSLDVEANTSIDGFLELE